MAKVGLLSDSHGRAATTRRAVALLLEQGAQRLIHLGDLGTVEIIDELLAPPPGGRDPVPADMVFGNVDWDWASMERYAKHVGVQVWRPVGTLEIDGKHLAFLHGVDPQALAQALEAHPDYLCHGHSHRQRDQRHNGTRFINPGALFRASTYTVALLDTQSDKLTFYEVREP